MRAINSSFLPCPAKWWVLQYARNVTTLHVSMSFNGLTCVGRGETMPVKADADGESWVLVFCCLVTGDATAGGVGSGAELISSIADPTAPEFT
jgi:hypothetical protein